MAEQNCFLPQAALESAAGPECQGLRVGDRNGFAGGSLAAGTGGTRLGLERAQADQLHLFARFERPLDGNGTMFKTVSQSFLESPIISAMELIISGLFTKIDDTSFLGVPLL